LLVGRDNEVAKRVARWASLVDVNGVRKLGRTPIVQLVGSPHSGKSELLGALSRQYRDVVPVAWLDFAQLDSKLRVHEVLNLLIFDLSRPTSGRTSHFGQLTFPRLMGAAIAIDMQLPQNRNDAVLQIERALENPAAYERMTRLITTVVQEGGKALQTPGQVPPEAAALGSLAAVLAAFVPDIVRYTLRRSRLGRRMISPLLELGLNPETLVDINQWMRSTEPALRDQAEEQVWAAFLEDLRQCYEGSAGHGRNLRCLALLDNIDSPMGETFVRALAKARTQPSKVDPLLVVSAGRRSVWDAQHAASVEAIELRDLNSAEVIDLATRVTVPAPSATADAVFALTGGHKGTAADLVTFCSRQKSYPYELLEQPADVSSLTARDVLRERLLPGLTEAEFQVLITCAPAIDIDHAQSLIRGNQLGMPDVDIRDLLSRLGWLRASRAHPVIRNLLLHELARRRPEHPWSWLPACRWFRDHPPGRIKSLDSATADANKAYYDLAIGEISAAIDVLLDLHARAPSEWLSVFDWAITAPSPHGVRHTPRTLVRNLVNRAIAPGTPEGSMRAHLTSLTVACWLADDRQLDPWHSLDQMIAHEYEAVAHFVEGDVFYARARSYRSQADRWSTTDQSMHRRPLPLQPSQRPGGTS
jgi:hypothetical protein